MPTAVVVPFLQVRGAAAYSVFLERAFGARASGERETAVTPHHALRIDDSWLEVAEATPEFPPTRIALHAYLPDADAAYERALRLGATSLMAPVDQPYGDREAAIADEGGNTWYLATHQGDTGHKPAGLRAITPYFHPVGASGFITFLERVFGALQRECHTSPEGSVLHSKMAIGDAVVELSDAHNQWQPTLAAVHLYLSEVEAAYERALAAGAESLYAPGGRRGRQTAGVRDPYGHSWYLDSAPWPKRPQGQ